MPASLTNFYTMVLTKCADNFPGNNWFIVRNNIITPTLEIHVDPFQITKLNRHRALAHHLVGIRVGVVERGRERESERANERER